jgi:hypothetical protein
MPESSSAAPASLCWLLGPRKRRVAGAPQRISTARLRIWSQQPVCAEVAAVLSDRCGGFLRERAHDIHTTFVAAGGEAA